MRFRDLVFVHPKVPTFIVKQQPAKVTQIPGPPGRILHVGRNLEQHENYGWCYFEN
jgi:hypothetical protein